MYIMRIIHFPALGKAAELRSVLLERNETANAAGSPHALAVSMFTPEQAFIHDIRFENLAAIEAYQDKMQSDSAFQAFGARVTSSLARPQAAQLHEVLAAKRPTAPPKFIVRNRLAPAAGKASELRGLLDERVQASEGAPGLLGANLTVQVGSADGPAFVGTLLFASLGALDEFRSHSSKDRNFQQFIAKAEGLTRAPTQQRIARVLAPFPA